jgi:type I restriction enzyme R subunit
MNINHLKEELKESLELKPNEESAKHCRKLLLSCVNYVYTTTNTPMPKNASLLELIDGPVFTSFVGDHEIIHNLHYVRILGMNAEHGLNIRKKELKLVQDNISYFIGWLEAKERGNELNYKKPQYMSEAATRKLYIDLYLKEAGWEVLDNENKIIPAKAGIEIKVEGMPNDKEYGLCDYVLYGRDGKPLAIVEVKKTSVNPEVGRHQVDLYAECMKSQYGYKPVMYYTNGYRTRIIDGIYPDRDVMAFHSLEDLELMIQRRKIGKISDLSINDEITNRPYQKIAITKICEWFNSNRRRGLLVMATGTGKTRLAISLVDILTRNGKVKNVLFLADRTTLVNQAKRNFAQLLPDMSICELSASGVKDYTARLMFCTYQTMINYIDAEDKRFSTGRFDLIIIDEAHRSIFNRYGTIFKYFDSLLVGLTATPKDEVDANTYHIFGCEAGTPNYDYSLNEAIHDKYLVGYTLRNYSSKILNDGINYQMLSNEEREQLEEYLTEIQIDLPTPDFNIPGNEIYKYLFNKDTCRKVIGDLMQWGHRVDGGETMGKTIIFAYNHKHAQMLVEVFHELYPNYPSNTCQLVDYQTNYGEDLVLKFEKDPEFRIAVSVDMLDTGVDVPAILNLVFFKKIRSKIKFVQMIGRGTRLCKDVFGPGRDKSSFQIFDYCGNFEYFNLHPDGETGKEMLTLSQRLFNVRLDMLFELQHIKYQEDRDMWEYYRKIQNELHSVVTIIKSHDSRIQVRSEMQFVDKYCDMQNWVSLSPVMINEIKRHLTVLVDSGLEGDFLSVAFDVRMYYIELDLLKNSSINNSASHIKSLKKCAQFLINEKSSVPQVRNKANDLRQLLSDQLWNNPTIDELEKLRISLRELMHFLQGRERKKYEIDIEDEVLELDSNIENTSIDIRTYREKVIDYLEENSDNPVVKKIYNLERISGEDLKTLEQVLWYELGTKDDYAKITSIQNLAAFVRSLIGLSQEAVNEKFGIYLNDNTFNSYQQEFVLTIINYVRENGDIEVGDMVNKEPFNNYDIVEMFGTNLTIVKDIVNTLHTSVIAQAA